MVSETYLCELSSKGDMQTNASMGSELRRKFGWPTAEKGNAVFTMFGMFTNELVQCWNTGMRAVCVLSQKGLW